MPDTENTSLHQPIVVIGAPRSGTTFLGQLLRAHPAVCYLEEPRLTWRYGNDRKSDMLRPDDARPAVCRYIRETFSKRVETSGKQRLAEKTPSNALRMGFVDRVLPGCRFVHITRHGIDSVISIHRHWQDYAGGVTRIKPGRIRPHRKVRRMPR